MTTPIRQAVAVFCGSKHGTNPVYTSDAIILAKELALLGLDIVYGGSKKGIMGDLANSALANGASVTGVIPSMLLAWEHEHESLTKLIITNDMHERKKTMYEMGIAGIVLPGGFGTLDEMFEMLTWNQLSIHDKKIYILNSGGFYDHLIKHMELLADNGFLYDPLWNRINTFDTPSALVAALSEDLKIKNQL
ncbi:MAG: TIGR00730 family Rossman fold protein [bacterium]|jgi:uncharacterized protein (TIGR00730 family)|nr:TIGR00730 family Rossman fold protein [Chitinophagaceae bacterium]